jgi:hypothetical protein
MTLPCDRMGSVFASLALPRDWFVSILDSQAVLVARTRKPQRY